MSSPSDSGSARMLTSVSGDLRHASRLLWKGKGLSAATLLTLALCIGATTAIFSILRVQPLLGEFFTKEQNRPGADKVVVLTQSFWQTQFSEDTGIVGKTIRIAGESYKVIGVAPRLFEAWDVRVKYIIPLSW